MYCGNCGEKNYPESNFCIYCGADLGKKKTSRKRLTATVSIISIILLIFIKKSHFSKNIVSVNYTGDIKNLSWGMTKEEVEKIENFRAKEYSNTSDPFLEYSISKKIEEDEFIKGYVGKIIYFFDSDKKLRRAELSLTHKKPKFWRKSKYYREIKKYFKENYGEGEEIKDYIIDDARAFKWETYRSRIVLVVYNRKDYFNYSVIYSDMDLLEELEN